SRLRIEQRERAVVEEVNIKLLLGGELIDGADELGLGTQEALTVHAPGTIDHIDEGLPFSLGAEEPGAQANSRSSAAPRPRAAPAAASSPFTSVPFIRALHSQSCELIQPGQLAGVLRHFGDFLGRGRIKLLSASPLRLVVAEHVVEAAVPIPFK